MKDVRKSSAILSGMDAAARCGFRSGLIAERSEEPLFLTADY